MRLTALLAIRSRVLLAHSSELLALSAFSKSSPYLFSAARILVETLAIRRDLDRLSLITLDNARQEIPKGWEPDIVPNLCKMEEERSLRVWALRVVKVAISRAII